MRTAAKTVVELLMIIASLVAAAFWIISATWPLTLTLDSLQTELQSAALYNQAAAWAAGVAAICQAMMGFFNWLGPEGRSSLSSRAPGYCRPRAPKNYPSANSVRSLERWGKAQPSHPAHRALTRWARPV